MNTPFLVLHTHRSTYPCRIEILSAHFLFLFRPPFSLFRIYPLVYFRVEWPRRAGKGERGIHNTFPLFRSVRLTQFSPLSPLNKFGRSVGRPLCTATKEEGLFSLLHCPPVALFYEVPSKTFPHLAWENAENRFGIFLLLCRMDRAWKE